MPPEVSGKQALRQYRKGSRYTVEERKIIEPYKDAFQSQESKARPIADTQVRHSPCNIQLLGVNWKGPMDEEESRIYAKVNYQLEACQGSVIDHITRN